MIKSLRIGGVPEHFNEPFHLAQQYGLWEKMNLNIEWHVIREGSGAMLAAIKNEKVDVIVGLTESIVADIANGSDIRLLGTYVASPLVWAISSGANSRYNSINELKDTTIAVSRLNSGSHLMAAVLASQQGWDKSSFTYAEKGAFDDMCASLNNNECSALMWETFMTKPYQDRGELKRIGELVSPWPSFVVAATTATINSRLDELQRMFNVIQQAIAIFYTEPQVISSISTKYHLQTLDAETWYKNVKIVGTLSVEEKAIHSVLDALKTAKILTKVDKIPAISNFVDDRLCKLV
jgi:ABC-type nitrate/sulfonate/bicarbonate transport system substrate-binding protein